MGSAASHDASATGSDLPEGVFDLFDDLEADDSSGGSAQFVAQLESRLAERERLVEILTARLEQAADELDRIQRTGGPENSGQGAVSDVAVAGLSSAQQEISDDLKRFHDAWEERYEGPALRRIEHGLDELKEMLEDLQSRGVPVQHGPAARDGHGQGQHGSVAASAMKSPLEAFASLLGSDGDDDIDKPDGGRSRQRSAPVRLIVLNDDQAENDDLVHLPTSLDPKTATREELVEGIESRDRYMRWLSRQVRSVAVDLESWMEDVAEDHDDEAVLNRLDELSDLIHRQLQAGEVELSIERARIAREQAQLSAASERLERAREEFTREASSTGDSKLMKRWQRILGGGR